MVRWRGRCREGCVWRSAHLTVWRKAQGQVVGNSRAGEQREHHQVLILYWHYSWDRKHLTHAGRLTLMILRLGSSTLRHPGPAALFVNSSFSLLPHLYCPPQWRNWEDKSRKGRRGGKDNWVWPWRFGLISAGGKPSSDTVTFLPQATIAGSQRGGWSSTMDALVSMSWFSVYWQNHLHFCH